MGWVERVAGMRKGAGQDSSSQCGVPDVWGGYVGRSPVPWRIRQGTLLLPTRTKSNLSSAKSYAGSSDTVRRLF